MRYLILLSLLFYSCMAKNLQADEPESFSVRIVMTKTVDDYGIIVYEITMKRCLKYAEFIARYGKEVDGKTVTAGEVRFAPTQNLHAGLKFLLTARIPVSEIEKFTRYRILLANMKLCDNTI